MDLVCSFLQQDTHITQTEAVLRARDYKRLYNMRIERLQGLGILSAGDLAGSIFYGQVDGYDLLATTTRDSYYMSMHSA